MPNHTAAFVNRTELRILGLSRSGNHCLVDWILERAPGRYCFLNCAEGKSSPFASARPLADGRRVVSNVPGLDRQAEERGSFRPKDLLIHSYEDSFLGHALSRVFEREHDRLVGTSRRRIDLLVLRDPFNLFASRRRMGCGLPRATALRMWKQHARAALQGSPHLRHRTLVFNYNRWLLSARYRERLAAALHLPRGRRPLETVARCAGGSSFDGLAYDGRASRMAVLDRWRDFADAPDFHTLFDAELYDLSDRLFGDSAPTPAWRRAPPVMPEPLYD